MANSGNYVGAKNAADTARNLVLAAIGVGILVNVIYLAFVMSGDGMSALMRP